MRRHQKPTAAEALESAAASLTWPGRYRGLRNAAGADVHAKELFELEAERSRGAFLPSPGSAGKKRR